MKITAAIYNNKTLEEVYPYIDAAVLMVPHYSYIFEDLDIDSAIEICKKSYIEPILSMQKIFLEDELEDLKSFITKYQDLRFLVSDLGVAQLFKEMDLIGNVIFDSPTMVCNSLDFDLYCSYGFKAVSMSNEITLKDIKDTFNKSEGSIYYQVFGRKIMFYSKRKLVDLYKEFRKISFENTGLTLKEEQRDYQIPIIQTENGTFCFRQYFISLLDQIKDISFVRYAYFESLTLTLEQYKKVLYIYRNYLTDALNYEQSKHEFDSLNLLVVDGFIYTDSVDTKEKVINEKN